MPTPWCMVSQHKKSSSATLVTTQPNKEGYHGRIRNCFVWSTRTIPTTCCCTSSLEPRRRRRLTNQTGGANNTFGFPNALTEKTGPLGKSLSPRSNPMNKYSTNILHQFTVKNGRLHYLTGPLKQRPAGHQRPNGQIYVKFNGTEYKHDHLLFLYTEQLESKALASIDTTKPHDYKTVSGYAVHFYTHAEDYNAPPYIIHGAVRINDLWHATQWTQSGQCIHTGYNLEKIECTSSTQK